MYQQSPADLIYPFQSKEHDVDGDDPGYVERRLKYKDHPEVIPWYAARPLPALIGRPFRLHLLD